MATDNSSQGGTDIIRDLARLGGAVKTQAFQLDLGGSSSNAEVLVQAGQQVMTASVPVVIASNQPAIKTADTADNEYLAVTLLAVNAGDTAAYTPAAGKRIKLYWVYAINDPAATAPARITIKLGTQTKYLAYGISKRQVDTGPVDGVLIVNLSAAGNVACTFRLEEI